MSLSGQTFPTDVVFTYIPIDIADQAQLENALACSIPTGLKIDSLLAELASTAAPNALVVSVPGAFTPTCTENHIPPFLTHLAKLKAKKNIGAVIIVSANDAFVLNAWGKLLVKDAKIDASKPDTLPKLYFASDGNAAFSQAHDLSVDVTAKGLGIRTARYALVVSASDRKVVYLGKETEPGVNHSGLDAVLGAKL